MEGCDYDSSAERDNNTDDTFDYFLENLSNQTNTSTNCTMPACEKLVLHNLMPYYVVFSLLTLAGIVGNALIIIVLRKHVRARTTAEIYVLNMAITDMLMLSMVPVLVTRNVMSYRWIFGDFLCRVYYLIAGLNMFNTVFILMAMSVDRYFCVSRPLRSLDWKTTRTAKIVCTLLWVVATVIDLPWVIWADIIPYCGTPMCLYDFPAYLGDERFWERLSEIGVLVLSFVIPIILISGTHIGILWHVRNAGAGLDRTQRSQQKVTRMVFAIVVVFVICWLPKNVAYLAERFDWFETPTEIQIGFEMLLITNSAINPYLYTIFGQHFQRRLMGIFFPAKHRQSLVTRNTVVMRCKNETPSGDRRRHDIAPNHYCLEVETHVEKTEDRSLSTSEKEAEICGHVQVEDTVV
ncbi:somatostatin receptor type 5-like [Branchiostoma lanceolatum]|uniref:somatostatin receptor type 5-like n=1 Tax=Branchiostoma lanceolatum TaxID=7740 RepID=UPI0034572AC2